MNKKQTFIILGVLIILLLSALIFKVNQPKKAVVINQGPVATTTNSTAETPAIIQPTSTDQYKTAAPKNIVIPVMNDQTLTAAQKKEIAVPTLVTPAAPGSASSLRSFTIVADGGKFTPSKIIGKVGDTMMVKFTAVDQDYSLVFPSYNMRQVAKKGETKTLGFHAGESGSFTYFCDICGENTTVSGTLIIAN